MLRNVMGVLAIVLVLECSGLSTSAFARGDRYGGNGGGEGFLGDQLSGFRHTPREGYGGYGNRASAFSGRFNGYGGRDVWGHWGAYYGPMVPTI